MFRFLIFRLSRRRAVSTMIAGVIVLSLLLVGLGAMVFVSQQNDQYQQSVEGMMQRNNQQSSESLVFNFPGLTLLTSTAVPGWGSGCTTTYNCYNMTVSNLGGVGVQVVRIYINSTGSGCTFPNPQPCVLNPTSTITNYGFNQANSFLNAGEVNHWLPLALPIGGALPNAPFSKNTISVVTSRGNVFSFQWPFNNLVGGQSQSAFSAGIMKVAYQYSESALYGYDSMNEAGPVAAGSGGTVTSSYCHTEPEQPYQAPATDAEKLAINSTDQTWGVRGGVLWFVNPWVSQDIINSAITNGPTGQVNGHPTWPSNLTTLYIYVNFTNVGSTNFTIKAGSMDLTWYSFNWIDANLIGYYQGAPPGKFYPVGSAHPVLPGASFYGIFKVTDVCLGREDCSVGSASENTWPPPTGQSVMFMGSAALTSNTGDTTFVAGVALLPGLWIRSSCP